MIPSRQSVSQKTVSTCIEHIIQEILQIHNLKFINMIRDWISIMRNRRQLGGLFKLGLYCILGDVQPSCDPCNLP